MRQTELRLSNKDRKAARRMAQQGSSPCKGSQSGAYLGRARREGARGADLPSPWGGSHGDLAYAGGVSGGRAGPCAARRTATRGASQVRNRRRGGARRAGLLETPDRSEALDPGVAGARGAKPPRYARHQPRNDPSAAKKNCLKPWREMMWCVGVLTRGVPAAHVRPAGSLRQALERERTGGLRGREEQATAARQSAEPADGAGNGAASGL